MAVILPARNEAAAIGLVLREIPAWASEVLVVDNGSTDGTGNIAASMGARVVPEPAIGYGAACLRGIEALPQDVSIVVFMDADHSDFPEEMEFLIAPLAEGRADLVVGSRVRGGAEPGSLMPVARFGNWLSTRLIRVFFGAAYTDLGPFRAVRRQTLASLGMRDRDFGWTVEMQVKAARQRVRAQEIGVRYRPRVGRSKVSGTVSGSIRAGIKILAVIGREAVAMGFQRAFARWRRPSYHSQPNQEAS